MAAGRRRQGRPTGELTIVGLGIRGIAQLTAEAVLAIQRASIVFHAAADDDTADWIAAHAKRAQDLTLHFNGRRRFKTAHDDMVKAILAALDRGDRVCAAFYGSPSVGVYPAHRALHLARRRGHAAVMLPGISADACLFADLTLDPLATGYQAYDATDFVRNRRKCDPTSLLVLWQIGLLDGRRVNQQQRQAVLERLATRLTASYGATHRAGIYLAATAPGTACRVTWVMLRHLPEATIPEASTLVVPAMTSRRRAERPTQSRR